MERCRILSQTEKLHFIGIGGIGMSALAQYALRCGIKVSGSDTAENEQVKKLAALGAKISIGHARKNAKGADAVVYTSAISEDNPEYLFARDNQKLLMKRAEFLRCVEQAHDLSVAVSGCHGKTTATAMLAHVFACANKSATSLIGGEDSDYGNFTFGRDIFLTEACEYKRNFLYLTPDVAVILNIDNDHLECYGDLDHLVGAYREFAAEGIAVVNADDENAVRAAGRNFVTFGMKNAAMYTCEDVRSEDGRYSFTLVEYGIRQGRVRLKTEGRHNVYNALAAVAAARQCGVSTAEAVRGVEDFKGVKRRWETIGELFGKKVIADYAHHPKEIVSALSSVKNPLVIFQPHTYSRTKLLMKDFVAALRGKTCVVYATYPAREKYDAEGSAYTLYLELKKAGGDAVYAEDEGRLLQAVRLRAEAADAVLALGAGDIYEVISRQIEKFGRKV